ncbi:MAG: hypothetical protein RLY92_856, partial [Chloroflexota bacterium]
GHWCLARDKPQSRCGRLRRDFSRRAVAQMRAVTCSARKETISQKQQRLHVVSCLRQLGQQA